ncbi:DHH family phosphoesterase [Pelagicoccus sp. NFK12]|uniref:DHH family phosphoesterase n=1 Tax=Pelagicoccus enzymogenes TaxID=2773457 RepID=A0A927F7U8_9BACT|nr:DHH family phosphoesterase [Pelagicoccus enzymogenes]MBD5779949.1 DHH family phosphoesterase [Pelagicoccus enzymogenes]MDQ8200807.1 DHH family phosphoesterase [Pelagicoccus enzymogenes]
MSYFPQLAERFSELFASIANDRVLVLGHARPDGDCIGAQLGLVRLLRSEGVDAVAYNADPVPDALSFLMEETGIEKFSAEALDGSSLLFVDCADEGRIGPKSSKLIEGSNYLGNIDHHISNTNFAHFNLVEPTSAATCEIIAGLAFDFGWDVDPLTAQCLLTGIMTDTGRYSYAATTSRVFELSARLVDCGARPVTTAQSLYENEPMCRLELLQRFLATLTTRCDGKLGTGYVLHKDFLDTGAKYEHTEGFVDFTRSIEGVKIGVYFEEKKSTVKGSFRAESAAYRVDKLARQFGGGGHACAAAFSTDASLDEIQPRVFAAIEQRLAEVEQGIDV